MRSPVLIQQFNHLFPAWPTNWDVSFKLYAPNQTIIEGVFKKGKTEWLKVTPEYRRKDIVIMLSETL
jgi:hypothetical protein